MRKRILIVEDESITGEDLRNIVSGLGHDVAAVVSCGSEAISEAERRPLDLALIDIRIKGSMDGTETAKILSERFDIPIVYLTGHVDLDTLRRARLSTPFGYIVKPFHEIEVQTAVETGLLRPRDPASRQWPAVPGDSAFPAASHHTGPTPPDTAACPVTGSEASSHTLDFGRFQLLAASVTMKTVLAFTLRIARTHANMILIEGESGTGKDLLAQFIHHSSSRADRPYVAINCAAIPEALLESELFGHLRGAFTDARADKQGLFEAASGGTIFLDEIGELAPAVQAKLLRVLENQTFRRLGAIRDTVVDVRIIAATNRNLADSVREGRFRPDLFHRLSVFPVTIPPLRERRAEILPLALHFLRQYSRVYNSRVHSISSRAAAMLDDYSWPGNVRELRNVIERAVVLENSTVLQRESLHFAQPAKLAATAASPFVSLKAAEQNLIADALERTGGNQTRAARILGISRDRLRYRAKRMGLDSQGRDQ